MLIHAKPPTTLIVEDDEVLGQVLAWVLTCEGRVVVHVSSSGKAFEQLRENCPRLVLVDATLRDGAGLKLRDAIRAAGLCLPVILLTTHRLEKSAHPTQGARLVSKSIDLPELRRMVNGALLECPTAGSDLELSSRGAPCRPSFDQPRAQSTTARP
jgi:DNA-binding response OmpR family regulator